MSFIHIDTQLSTVMAKNGSLERTLSLNKTNKKTLNKVFLLFVRHCFIYKTRSALVVRVPGIEPGFSAWKADIIAFIRHPHILLFTM